MRRPTPKRLCKRATKAVAAWEAMDGGGEKGSTRSLDLLVKEVRQFCGKRALQISAVDEETWLLAAFGDLFVAHARAHAQRIRVAEKNAGVEGVKDKKHGRGKRHELYIGCYVDDLTCVSSDSTALDFFDKVVGDRFPFNPTEMRDLDASKGKEGLGWVETPPLQHTTEAPRENPGSG